MKRNNPVLQFIPSDKNVPLKPTTNDNKNNGNDDNCNYDPNHNVIEERIQDNICQNKRNSLYEIAQNRKSLHKSSAADIDW